MDYIIKKIADDTEKVDTEIIMSDILPVLELISYYKKNAADILKKKNVSNSFLFYNNKSYIEYNPMGIISIISPWNYPLQLALIPTITALIAGNIVILKPSELTPIVADLIEEIFENAELPWKLVYIIRGEKEAVQKIIDLRPEKIFFTGSTETGKEIMKQASEQLIPLQLELGGKDPMIVFDDADLERAANAAIYGAFANSGQLCVSIERLYVKENVYEQFLWLLKEKVEKIRIGQGYSADIGPLINKEIFNKIEVQLDEALNRGAELLTEYDKKNDYLSPQIIKNVKNDMLIMQEESFGPVLPVMSFKSERDVVALANDNKYGLNSSIWTQDNQKAKRIASKLMVGNCYINNVIINIGNPHLPFGGIKDSGFGKYHGEKGLINFSFEKSVMIKKGNSDSEINWFPYSKKKFDMVYNLLELLHKKENIFKKLKRILKLFKNKK